MPMPMSIAEDARGTAPTPVDEILSGIARLPDSWHSAGTMGMPVLRAMVRHTRGQLVRRSVETGAGKSTLLLSHLSGHHTVFAVDYGNSVSNVRASALFHKESVHFVDGPTQTTLPAHSFAAPLDLALLDGPHAYPFPELEYFFIYPKLAPGALLIVDDIHVPTIHHLFCFLGEDAMWKLIEVVGSTAFFRRTDAPTFNPNGDGWELQRYNRHRFPVGPLEARLRELGKRVLPASLVRALKARLER